MFSDQMVRDIVAVAERSGIEPAAMLAVVEIESSGRPFEDDGATPRFLFERHIFHRELRKRAPGQLDAAVAQGLAHPAWQRATQYKDQKSSAQRMALLARARAIDEECANRSCSWGLGQTMGFLAEELGFANAGAMLAFLNQGGTSGQLELMVKFIRNKNILNALNQHDWDAFALRYNGKGFKQNSYDTKLANAYAKWKVRGLSVGATGGAAQAAVPLAVGGLATGARGDEVVRLQTALRDLGYQLGEADGIFGSLTRGAVLAFQADKGLPKSGVADQSTLDAMSMTPPRPLSDARANATEDDLRKRGSQVIGLTDWLKKLSIGTGVLGALGVSQSQLGAVSRVTDTLKFLVTGTPPAATGTAAGTGVPVPTAALDPLIGIAKGLIGSQGGLGILLIGAAVLVWRNAKQVASRRVEDHRTGANVGL